MQTGPPVRISSSSSSSSTSKLQLQEEAYVSPWISFSDHHSNQQQQQQQRRRTSLPPPISLFYSPHTRGWCNPPPSPPLKHHLRVAAAHTLGQHLPHTFWAQAQACLHNACTRARKHNTYMHTYKHTHTHTHARITHTHTHAPPPTAHQPTTPSPLPPSQ